MNWTPTSHLRNFFKSSGPRRMQRFAAACCDAITSHPGTRVYTLMSDEERQDIAHRLITRGLNQGQVAKVMGIARESVNRMLRRREQRIQRLRELCLAGGDCHLVQMLSGAA